MLLTVYLWVQSSLQHRVWFKDTYRLRINKQHKRNIYVFIKKLEHHHHHHPLRPLFDIVSPNSTPLNFSLSFEYREVFVTKHSRIKITYTRNLPLNLDIQFRARIPKGNQPNSFWVMQRKHLRIDVRGISLYLDSGP